MHIMQYGAENIIKSWPKYSRDTTEIVLDKYGEPNDEATPSFLIWYNRCIDDRVGDFKKNLFLTCAC